MRQDVKANESNRKENVRRCQSRGVPLMCGGGALGAVVSASRLHRVGRGFESLSAHHSPPGSAVPKGDARLAEVVGRHFDVDLVADADADEVLPHLAGDMGENLVAVGQSDPEHGELPPQVGGDPVEPRRGRDVVRHVGLVHPGIRQFKEGFGGREVRLIGAWDLPLSTIGWRSYRLAEGRHRRPRELTAGASAG